MRKLRIATRAGALIRSHVVSLKQYFFVIVLIRAKENTGIKYNEMEPAFYIEIKRSYNVGVSISSPPHRMKYESTRFRLGCTADSSCCTQDADHFGSPRD